ncbi:hypothetical protein METP3_01950 [Methanosarcinales archaeon]|nr:hypothetical protein METP3_01950 [Methanosarcinales archaeon]
MDLKNGIYIIECIPQEERLGEGEMLNEFLKIIMPSEDVDFEPIENKNDFFNKLNRNNSKVVHISCHGNTDDNKNLYIALPDDDILPEDFYESDHLRGRGVVVTGCLLGRKDFADEFLKRTSAKSLIAPLNLIDSFDVAMWCINFYYLVLAKGYTFVESYKYMKKRFYVPGAMKMWILKEE